MTFGLVTVTAVTKILSFGPVTVTAVTQISVSAGLRLRLNVHKLISVGLYPSLSTFLTPPLVDVHVPSKNDPFSLKLFGFWGILPQIFYISSANIYDDRL